MNIDTVRFSHILEADHLYDLNYFLSHTAFIISHKSESIETLLSVIWYLPINSPIIIVTNCPETEREHLEQGLAARLTQHEHIYLIHQKDEYIAHFFAEHGASCILGADGRVVDGKGEGMYIGALAALLLEYPEWVLFYDADNFVPSALLEYTLAMGRLFMAECSSSYRSTGTALWPTALHNVRVCWSSKPHLGSKTIAPGILGRCTKVVSPLCTALVEELFGIKHTIICSNAGEQGLSIQTAKTLRFSSGFSVETFQLLDFLFTATAFQQERCAILQQYQSKSPHFHEKRGDEHIKRMIADSLGSFFHFKEQLPPGVERQLQQVYDDMNLEFRIPVVYPPLQEVLVERNGAFVNQYKLFEKSLLFAGQGAMCG